MFDADVAFVNGGGVRANIPTGDITFQQIINVHPFGNTAVLAEVTGQQILDALEMGARVNPGENGGFLQVAGLKYEIHNYIEPNCVVGTDKMWAGPVDASLPYRVQNVRILNKETGEYEDLDLTKKYTLASHNYMLMDMGDGFAMFGPNITILEDSGKLDNQVLIDYIQSMPEVDGVHQVEGYTDPRGEGRITIYAEAPTPVEPTGDTIVLFTNDVHCGIRDGWGYAGLADLKKTLEAEGNEVILVDAGDHVQGGPIGSLTQGEAIIDIMNFVGYDLATLGNHEFDYGMDQIFALVLEVLNDFFKKLCQKIVVLEFRLQKPVKHLLTASLHLLGDGKFHVEEIAPELAGHSAAQDLAVFFQRFFLHSRQGIMQLPDHFSLFVHVTAADPADAAVGFYELSYLADRLFIHRVSSF
jgi:2',3'-cyclic-nucleotide 2'-phosphodiesterase (5'-nucleotidase family)